MPSYTLRRSGGALPTVTTSLADWGVREDSVRLRFAARAVDTMGFTLADAFDAAESFPWGCTVELLRDGTRVFHGRVTSMPREGTAASESVSVEAAGPWWYLEHLTYEQTWNVPDTSVGALPGALVAKPLTRVIIGRNLGAEKITAADFITDVFTFLATHIAGAPVALGSLHADLSAEIPTEEVRDITCAEAILRTLRWFPDIEPRWDLAATTPTLHFGKRGDTRLALDPASVPLESVSLKARPDLKPSCVLIRYQRANEYAGAAGVEIIEDKYPTGGDEYALDALRMVVELEGGSGSIQTQYIKTAAIRTDLPDWWKRHLPALKSDKVTALAVVPGSNSVTADEDAEAGASVYTAEILDGAIPWWKTYRETPAIAAAKLTYTVTLESGATEDRTDLARIRIRSTDAETGTYSYAGDYRAPEAVPTGLAQRYFNALAPLVHEGGITHAPTEWDGISRIGHLIDLPGLTGRPDWATLGAPVVSHEIELSSGRSRYTLGPAKHLAPDDWVSLARPARGITHATRPAATTRSTGRYTPASGSASGTATPAAASGSPRATPSVLALTGASASQATLSFPFQVSAVAKSPVPATGPTHDVTILNGMVNEELARYAGAIYRHLASILLPMNFTGDYKYVFLRLSNGNPPEIFVGDSVPWDSSVYEYILIAAVLKNTPDQAGKYGYTIEQFINNDLKHRYKLPFECTLTNVNGGTFLTVKDGMVRVSVGDVVDTALFKDDRAFGGQKDYKCGASFYPVSPTVPMSVWVAIAYPNDGTMLSTALQGVLQVTPSYNMPASSPWLVVAEKNTVTAAARNATTDGAVTTTPNGATASTAVEALTGRDSAETTAYLNTQAPPEFDTSTDVQGAIVSGTTKSGPFDVTYTKQQVTRIWFKGGKEIKRLSATLVLYCQYAVQSDSMVTGALAMSIYPNNKKPGSSDTWDGTYPLPLQGTPNRLSNDYQGASADGFNAWAIGSTLPSSGTGALQNGPWTVISGGTRLLQGIAQWYHTGTYYSYIDPTFGAQVGGRGGITYHYVMHTGGVGAEKPENSNDHPGPQTSGAPGSSYPGRPEITPGAISNSNTTQGAKKANGTLATESSSKNGLSGRYVYEIARISPDLKLDQRLLGDIYCHPAAQVQLRTNPNITQPA